MQFLIIYEVEKYDKNFSTYCYFGTYTYIMTLRRFKVFVVIVFIYFYTEYWYIFNGIMYNVTIDYVPSVAVWFLILRTFEIHISNIFNWDPDIINIFILFKAIATIW